MTRGLKLGALQSWRSSSMGPGQREAAVSASGAQAGVGIATVRKIETGAVVEPGYFTVIALMGALRISPGYLCT